MKIKYDGGITGHGVEGARERVRVQGMVVGIHDQPWASQSKMPHTREWRSQMSVNKVALKRNVAEFKVFWE